MPCRFLLFAFLTIGAATAIVLVACKSDCVCSQRQKHSETHCVTEVVREHAFPADCMPAARPVSKAVRHPSVPLPNESRAELRKVAPADNDREQAARRLASEKNQVMDELLAQLRRVRPLELRRVRPL